MNSGASAHVRQRRRAPIEVNVQGIVVSGKGEAAGFTELPWAARQFEERLGFRPSPGTLNVQLIEESERTLWREVGRWRGFPIEPPGSTGCAATCYPAVVSSLKSQGERLAFVIVPHVRGYPEDQVELLADQHLRSVLDLIDGDAVEVRICGFGIASS